MHSNLESTNQNRLSRSPFMHLVKRIESRYGLLQKETDPKRLIGRCRLVYASR